MRAPLILLAAATACHSGGKQNETGRTQGTGTMPDFSVDVLVIGAGPAGLSAAWEAEHVGATVMVVEMGDVTGGSGRWAGNFYAAASPWQGSMGIVDTIEAALADWPVATQGGDATDPQVVAFVQASTGTIQWLVDDLGCSVNQVFPDAGMGTSAPRGHGVSCVEGAPVDALAADIQGEILTSTQGESLVLREGRVVGAVITDLVSGDSAWVEAGAVVVATGGFARDSARLVADRPELGSIEYVVETGPLSLGGGHLLLEGAGVAFQNQGSYGMYTHSLPDILADEPQEALWVTRIETSLIVDGAGLRVADENDAYQFFLYPSLVAGADQVLWALWPEEQYRQVSAYRPTYNWVDSNQANCFSSEEILAADLSEAYATLSAAATGLAMDFDILTSTVERYDAFAATGLDTEFGKPGDQLIPFEDAGLVAMKLRPGAAKAFGGVSLDASARALNGDGDPIPGLYAAGEVAGFLGTPAVAQGFSGALTACYYTGRLAGASAAAQ